MFRRRRLAVDRRSYKLDQNTAVASGSAALGSAASTERALVTIPKNRLVHAVASLQVGVKSTELSAKTNEASQIVGSFGGYAQSVRYQHSRNGYGNAVLRAARAGAEGARPRSRSSAALGTLLSQQVSTQDLQAKVTQSDERDRLAAARDRRLREGARRARRSPRPSGSPSRSSSTTRATRSRSCGTLATPPVASGATADISLLLTTQNHAVVGADHHGSRRIGRLLGSAAHFLALEGIIVLYALIVLAPFLLLGGARLVDPARAAAARGAAARVCVIW